MPDEKLQRLGRKKHPVLGEGVEVAYRQWDGWRQREEWCREWFPVRQVGLTKHPRCPTGYPVSILQGPDIPAPTACVSRSASYYEDLCKYAGFRWR